MARKRLDVNTDDLVARYIAGESEKSLSQRYGIARTAIRPRLEAAGVTRRNRSASMYLRMAQTGPDERKRLALAANVARRGSNDTMDTLLLRSATADRTLHKMRNGEIELACLLSGRGMFADLQAACGQYNIDLAFPPVAVEVHWSTNHPLKSAHQRKRVEDLADLGWRTLYVWRNPGRTESGYASLAVDEIVAHVERAQSDPSSVRECRVIRSTGEDVA